MEQKETNLSTGGKVLKEDGMKKIIDFFTLLVQIDQRQKGKENDRHN